jgi:uncharacterized protein YkwD
MRSRRPVLPALTAVVAGALVAGTATLLSGPAAGSSADQPQQSVEFTSERPDSNGSLQQPETAGASTTSPAAESTAPPALSSAAAAPTTTTTPPAPPPPPQDPPVTATSPDTSAQDQVVTLTNARRQEAGCGPLKTDANITAAAQGHAADMAARGYFSHTTPEGVTFDQRIRNAGYPSPGAENIARGARTADDVVAMWMDSPGHRANILNCDLNTIGVGLDTNGFYWVQNFGF